MGVAHEFFQLFLRQGLGDQNVVAFHNGVQQRRLGDGQRVQIIAVPGQDIPLGDGLVQLSFQFGFFLLQLGDLLLRSPVGDGLFDLVVFGLALAEQLPPGLAGAAASALDAMKMSVVLGTIAGDDTVIVVMRDTNSAAAFCGEIKNLMN